MAGLDGELSGVHRDVAELNARAGIADRRIDSLRSGRRQRDPQSTRRIVLGDLAVHPKMPAPQTPKSTLVPSQDPVHAYVLQTMKRSVQMQECRQGAQATSGIGVVARAKRLRRSCRKPSRRDGRDPHGCEARSSRVTSQISGHDKRHRNLATAPSVESRETSSGGRVFHDSPMDRSRRRHGGEKVSPYQRLSHMGALVHALRRNRNLLTGDEVLPKSIHRCRRYPCVKFNSGRDYPPCRKRTAWSFSAKTGR